MKLCPVCATTVFGDMDTCYNCMYRFGSNEELEECVAASSPEPAATVAPGGPAEPVGPLPGNAEDRVLFAEFLVELEGFLRQFLADRVVDVK